VAGAERKQIRTRPAGAARFCMVWLPFSMDRLQLSMDSLPFSLVSLPFDLVFATLNRGHPGEHFLSRPL